MDTRGPRDASTRHRAVVAQVTFVEKAPWTRRFLWGGLPGDMLNPMTDRVLVVDDDAPTRHMIAAVLQRESFSVVSCGNGQQALGHLAVDEFGAIVLSLVQRDPDGDDEVLLRLKQQPKPPCVILISAGSKTLMDSVSSDLIKARLRKPFAIQEFVGAVKSCFSG